MFHRHFKHSSASNVLWVSFFLKHEVTKQTLMVTGWGLPTDWLYLRPLSRLYLDTRIVLTLSIPAVTNFYWVSLLGVKSCKHCGPCMTEGLMLSRCSGHSFLITVFPYQGKWVWNLISINVINRSGRVSGKFMQSQIFILKVKLIIWGMVDNPKE